MYQNNIFLLILCFSTCFAIGWADSRIMGGDKVTNRTNYAYQVSIRYNGGHICGGTIINNSTILTAAFCCYLDDKGTLLPHNTSLKVVSGTLHLTDQFHEIKSTVSKIIIHPDYNNITLANNIAILKLTDELVFNDKVSNIKQVTKTPKMNDICIVSGWGISNLLDPYVTINLMSAQIQIGDFNKCKTKYAKQNVTVPSGTICDGETYKKTCNYDAGDPLVCYGALAGIVSFEISCDVIGIPGVYTDIASYRDWIDSNSALSFNSHAPYLSVFLGFVFYLLFLF